MATVPYYGAYALFDTPSKQVGGMLMGADNIVGDLYTIEFRTEHGNQVPWIINRFGKEIGYIEGEAARELVLCQARDWKINAILASVFYSQTPEPGHYWGEFVVICYSKSNEEVFDRFVQGVSKMLAEGNRPTVNLGQNGFQQVLDSKGDWLPTTRQDKYTLDKGHAVVKDHRTFNEGIVESARSRHPGCMVVGWVFIFAVIATIAWFVKGLLGF